MVIPYIILYYIYSFARAFSTRDATSGAAEDAEPAIAEPEATEEAGAEPTSP